MTTAFSSLEIRKIVLLLRQNLVPNLLIDNYKNFDNSAVKRIIFK